MPNFFALCSKGSSCVSVVRILETQQADNALAVRRGAYNRLLDFRVPMLQKSGAKLEVLASVVMGNGGRPIPFRWLARI